mmetsp:Transcript_22280/g.33952  ORF Transcript_22280/g.33952 Transcript_22280/m.33952 type:complete len:157 (+) Transcript_22280:2-472(+)
MISLQQDLHFRKTRFGNIQSNEDLVPVLMLLAIIGTYWTGYFELNLVDSLHTTMHYLGVAVMCIGSFGLGIATNWSTYAVVLLTLEVTMGVIWFIVCACLEKQSNDLAIVTRNSKICIGTELIMFNVTNLIICSTIHACGANEGNVWASPFVTFDK